MQAVLSWQVMKIDSGFSPDFHRKMHSVPCGLNPAPNHKIVLTPQNSERILLLVRVNRWHLHPARQNRKEKH
jgi:hypothetical protein